MTIHLSPSDIAGIENISTSSGLSRTSDDARSSRPRNALENNIELFEETVPQATSSEERTFDARVELKVETANVAMHLSGEVRKKLFSEFDYLLDVDSWDENDRLPNVETYRRFLKWIIYTKDTSWTSLGIDDAGSILVAWAREDRMMTANFSDPVRWTKRVDVNGFPQISLGEFDLDYFAEQSVEFLS